MNGAEANALHAVAGLDVLQQDWLSWLSFEVKGHTTLAMV